MASRLVPPELEPFLRTPQEHSLILITSILGVSANWLTLQYIRSLLAPETADTSGRLNDAERKATVQKSKRPDTAPAVVLVSFMRDFGFWKDGAARLATFTNEAVRGFLQGADLLAAIANRRLRYIDGLSGLFSGEILASGVGAVHGDERKMAGKSVLRSTDLDGLSAEIRDAVGVLSNASSKGTCKRVVLIIDQLDLLLAATPEVTAVGISRFLLSIRGEVHATILTAAADTPLIRQLSTPLETEHGALVMSAAYQAKLVLSVRGLSTGTAKEVSGVLRVTGDCGEGEWLYFVGKDGGVRLWTRGE